MLISVSCGVMREPTRLDDASLAVVYGNDGKALVIVVELPGGSVYCVTAGDPNFAAVAKQYGLSTSPVEVVKV